MADVSAISNYAFSVVNITESPNSHTMIDNELSVRTLVSCSALHASRSFGA